MTNREFFSAISASAELSAEIRNHAIEALAKLDNAGSARRSKDIEKRAEANAPLISALASVLADGVARTASDIVALNIEGIASTSKATVIAKAVPNVKVTDTKVKGGRSVKVYSL